MLGGRVHKEEEFRPNIFVAKMITYFLPHDKNRTKIKEGEPKSFGRHLVKPPVLNIYDNSKFILGNICSFFI